MLDEGHRYSDKQLAKLEKNIKERYQSASKNIESRISSELREFDREDKKKREDVDKGVLTWKAYIAWRKRQLLKSKAMKEEKDKISSDMVDMNDEFVEKIHDTQSDVYTFNYLYGMYEVDSMYDLGLDPEDYTLEEMLDMFAEMRGEPQRKKDKKYNGDLFTSALLASIIGGFTVAHMAKYIAGVSGRNAAAMLRQARSLMTTAENKARQDAYSKYGGDALVKEWVAVMDERTRYSHAEANGQIVPIDEPFILNAGEGMYPGDPNLPPEERINCRCRMILHGVSPTESFSEWKKHER